MSTQQDPERRPLLSNESSNHADGSEEQIVDFEDDDPGNPRNWEKSWKYIQTLQIFILAFIPPMASAVFAPAIEQIASTFDTTKQVVLLGQTGFVCMLGIGPLFLAPMSETFGRRTIFLLGLCVFTLLQIPTALAPNVKTFVVLRTIGGFFGSVGVANGGGSISDMFATHERAQMLGIYLIGPLLGPSIGPLVGGLIVSYLSWRWIFWVVMILSGAVAAVCYLFLHESNAVAILQIRKNELQKKYPDRKFKAKGASNQGIVQKILQNSNRAVRILSTQPIVMTMSSYQALIFASMYSLYAQYSAIWSNPPYNFDQTQVGLAYIGPATGFIITSIFIVAFIDRVYDYLARRNHNDGLPEYRLPLANIGAVFLPVSIFWFGWTVEKQLSWPIPFAATLFFGASHVSIFNASQNYYIDSYESSAASALAAGAFLRSMVGGIVPLFVGGLFKDLGYGWGMSIFGILSVILMPAPLLFQVHGKSLREKFPFKP